MVSYGGAHDGEKNQNNRMIVEEESKEFAPPIVFSPLDDNRDRNKNKNYKNHNLPQIMGLLENSEVYENDIEIEENNDHDFSHRTANKLLLFDENDGEYVANNAA